MNFLCRTVLCSDIRTQAKPRLKSTCEYFVTHVGSFLVREMDLRGSELVDILMEHWFGTVSWEDLEMLAALYGI